MRSMSASLQRRLVDRVALTSKPAAWQASRHDPKRRISSAGDPAVSRPRCQASYAPLVSGSPGFVSSAAACARASRSWASEKSGVRTRPG